MASKKNVSVGLVVLLVAFIAWKAWPRKKAPDEVRINAIIRTCVDGFREKTISDCMEHISPNFSGRAGSSQASKGELKRFLTFRVLRGGGLDARILTQDITVSGDIATAELTAVMAQGGLLGAAQGNAAAKAVTLSFSREDGEWLVASSDYRDAL